MSKTIAVILAAGQGKRMNSDIPKQYLLLEDKPILYYSINAFEISMVDEIILVVGAGEIDFCKNEIVDKYKFKKVSTIIEGGKERYHSVYNALHHCTGCEVVMIHDGARPFVTAELVEELYSSVLSYKYCVLGVPVKDTIRIVDENGVVKQTPNRKSVWSIQTPQGFLFDDLRWAYDKLIKFEEEDPAISSFITDDAMEQFLNEKVKVIIGKYENIKVTTPEDLNIAQTFLRQETP